MPKSTKMSSRRFTKTGKKCPPGSRSAKGKFVGLCNVQAPHKRKTPGKKCGGGYKANSSKTICKKIAKSRSRTRTMSN